MKQQALALSLSTIAMTSMAGVAAADVQQLGGACPIEGDMMPWITTSAGAVLGGEVDVMVTGTPNTLGFFALDLGTPQGAEIGQPQLASLPFSTSQACSLMANPSYEIGFVTNASGQAALPAASLIMGGAFTVQAVFLDARGAEIIGSSGALFVQPETESDQTPASSGPLQPGAPQAPGTGGASSPLIVAPSYSEPGSPQVQVEIPPHQAVPYIEVDALVSSPQIDGGDGLTLGEGPSSVTIPLGEHAPAHGSLMHVIIDYGPDYTRVRLGMSYEQFLRLQHQGPSGPQLGASSDLGTIHQLSVQ